MYLHGVVLTFALDVRFLTAMKVQMSILWVYTLCNKGKVVPPLN